MIKKPIIIALIISAVVFVVLYYYFNCHNQPSNGKKNKKSKSWRPLSFHLKLFLPLKRDHGQ